MIRKNPCLKCGACCAFFRVSFYWGEADQALGGIVPSEYTEDITPFFRAMKGTSKKNPRCIALLGEVGNEVHCQIYDQRSSTCRDFGLHWEDPLYKISPAELERCNNARKAWGLLPLALTTPRFSFERPVMHREPKTFPRIRPLRKLRRGGRKPSGLL